MSGRACGVCDATSAAGARYCADCGAPLDATVISLERDHPTAPGRDDDLASEHHDGRRRSRLIAAGIIGLLAVVGVAVALGGSDPTADADRAARTPTPALFQRPGAPRPIPSATPIAVPTATPRPTATPEVAASPVDPDALPAMNATHLAVLTSNNLQFLDLATGVWSRTDLGTGSQPVGLTAATAGAVVSLETGTVQFAPIDGSEPFDLAGSSTGYVVGNGRSSYVTLRQDSTTTVILAQRFDGTESWRATLPPWVWPNGVTASGDVIVQYGERIVVLDGDTGAQRLLTTGTATAAVADSVVVWSCDEALACATTQLDLLSGARTVVSDDYLYLESAGSGAWRAYPNNGSPVLYRIVDGVLTQADGEASDPGYAAAIDETGTQVAAREGDIVFTDADGTEWVRIPSPVDQADNVLLALITDT